MTGVRVTIALLVGGSTLAAGCSGRTSSIPSPGEASPIEGGTQDVAARDATSPADLAIDTGGWTLAWSDEFNGPDGSPPDPAKWTYDLGGGGWGNSELEDYTNALENAQQKGGRLDIHAEVAPSGLSCWYGACRYTSARLKTEGLFTQAYGRFAASAQVPKGQGLWPAFWMLGDDIETVSWPRCGEIDIMEEIGSLPAVDHGTVHGPTYTEAGVSGPYGHGGTSTLPSGDLSDAFHVYAVDWSPTSVAFSLDDTIYYTVTAADLAPGDRWVFDHPFFLLLNLAVGGDWPGSPDATTTFPADLLVDWVRVYSR